MKKNLVALDDDDEDKEKNHQKEKKQAKEKSTQDRESSVESNTSEIRATRGRKRRQKNNGGYVSSKDVESVKGKESSVEVKRQNLKKTVNAIEKGQSG